MYIINDEPVRQIVQVGLVSIMLDFDSSCHANFIYRTVNRWFNESYYFFLPHAKRYFVRVGLFLYLVQCWLNDQMIINFFAKHNPHVKVNLLDTLFDQ